MNSHQWMVSRGGTCCFWDETFNGLATTVGLPERYCAVVTGNVQDGGCSTMQTSSLKRRHGESLLLTSEQHVGEQESNLNCHKTLGIESYLLLQLNLPYFIWYTSNRWNNSNKLSWHCFIPSRVQVGHRWHQFMGHWRCPNSAVSTVMTWP